MDPWYFERYMVIETRWRIPDIFFFWDIGDTYRDSIDTFPRGTFRDFNEDFFKRHWRYGEKLLFLLKSSKDRDTINRDYLILGKSSSVLTSFLSCSGFFFINRWR
jgi:hypothetical protein